MKSLKRIIAIIAIVVILGLYILTIISALLAKPEAHNLFTASIWCTVLFPILIYIYMWVYKLLRGRGVDKHEAPAATEVVTEAKKGE